jgi:hypothetical protein
MNENLSGRGGFWPVLMTEALSALPDAPVVDDRPRPRLPRSRSAVALRLHRLADVVAPRPVPEVASPC